LLGVFPLQAVHGGKFDRLVGINRHVVSCSQPV
jgi:hypothetical protein